MTLKTFKTSQGDVGKFLLSDLVEHPDYFEVNNCIFNKDVLGSFVIGDYTEPVSRKLVPPSVTMRQARLALLKVGKLSAVNTAIANMTGAAGEAARIEWDFSNEVQRNQPLVAALSQVLEMSDTQLDDLFIMASEL